MADKYRKIRREEEKIPDNEIRVRAVKRDGIGRYLNRAVKLYKEGEKTIVLKGVKDAIEKVIQLGELIRHRVKGLHQVIAITSTKFTDEYEPLEEGLDHLTFDRHEPSVVITLSKDQLDSDDVGYSAPIPDSEVQEFEERKEGSYRRTRSEGRPEGGRGMRRGRGGFRAGFRGRGDGFRGRRGGDFGAPRRDRSYQREEGTRDRDGGYFNQGRYPRTDRDYRDRDRDFRDRDRDNYQRPYRGGNYQRDDDRRERRPFRGGNYQRDDDRYDRPRYDNRRNRSQGPRDNYRRDDEERPRRGGYGPRRGGQGGGYQSSYRKDQQ